MNFDKILKLIQAYRAGQINKRKIRKFLLIVCSITGSYLVIASIVTMSLLASSNQVHSVRNPYIPQQSNNPAPAINNDIQSSTSDDDEDESLLRPLARTNVLILGIDDARLADVVIVGSFERDTGNINLLHIPRDTFTQVPPERIERMRENGLWFPASGMVKLNAMRSLGREFGIQYMQEQLSETLGIEFHYYVEIDIRAFRDIVDLVGPIEIEVPRRMFYYDPYQDLIIDIPAGVHLMDGQMAEYFVRYREYPNADLGRISAQQQFMTQLFRQTLRRETIMNNPVEIARIALGHVQTDIGLDLIRYIPYIGNLSPERIFTYTLPGNERRVQGLGSVWVPDGELVPDVINRMFFGVQEEPQAIPVMAHTGAAASINARIAVFNGTNIGGVARTAADRLHLSGYQIVHVGPYLGNREYRTRINVREEGLGEDLVDYFNNAVIMIDSRMSADFDIMVIVGRSEQ